MKIPHPLRLIAVTGFLFGTVAAVQAQATRTWVSGVGDDVNPCSRTAPCKTLAGAISKTAAGGEINAIDPGGFGAVTINKSLTIDLSATEGGVLAGGNGVVVNAQSTDAIVLRGLDVFGVNPPTHGIRFIAGHSLLVQHCRIKRFNAANSFGISCQPSTAAQLFVSDTFISQNGSGGTGGGILVKPTGGGSVNVTLDNVNIEDNTTGLTADGTGTTAGVNVVVSRSTVSGNAGNGVTATSPAGGAPVVVIIEKSCLNANIGTAVTVNSANPSGLGSATVRVGDSLVSLNNIGMSATAQGVLRSYGNNYIDGNLSANGPFTTSPTR